MGYIIGVVDDHPLLREGLKTILLQNSKVNKVLTFSDGEDVIHFLKEGGKVDVFFMDILMPKRDGLYTTDFIKKYYSDIKVLGLSSIEKVEYVEKMIAIGVDGYLQKDCNLNDISEALNAVLSNKNYFCPKIIVALSVSTKVRLQNKKQSLVITGLSHREIEVYKCLCNGMGRAEIASSLFISEKTVDKHKENIYKKTGCKNVIHLVVKGIKQGVLKLEELEQSLQ